MFSGSGTGSIPRERGTEILVKSRFASFPFFLLFTTLFNTGFTLCILSVELYFEYPKHKNV